MPGVPALRQGVNPATWMLEVSTPAAEQRLGLDFADAYRKSELFKCAACRLPRAGWLRERDAELDRPPGMEHNVWSWQEAAACGCMWLHVVSSCFACVS
jgi:hypothetical protein